jgi:hypothetical protein
LKWYKCLNLWCRDIFYFDITALDWKEYTNVYVQVSHIEKKNLSIKTQNENNLQKIWLKKENNNFPHIEGNSDRSGFKVIYEEGLPNIWRNAQIFSHIYCKGTVSRICRIWLCNRSLLDFLIYKENLVFSQKIKINMKYF